MTGWGTGSDSFLEEIKKLRVNLTSANESLQRELERSSGTADSTAVSRVIADAAPEPVSGSMTIAAPRTEGATWLVNQPQPAFPQPILSPLRRAILGPSADAVERALQGLPPETKPLAAPPPPGALLAEHRATRNLGTGFAAPVYPPPIVPPLDFLPDETERPSAGWVPGRMTLGKRGTTEGSGGGGYGGGAPPTGFEPGLPDVRGKLYEILGGVLTPDDDPQLAALRKAAELREKRINTGDPLERGRWRYQYAKWDQLNRTP